MHEAYFYFVLLFYLANNFFSTIVLEDTRYRTELILATALLLNMLTGVMMYYSGYLMPDTASLTMHAVLGILIVTCIQAVFWAWYLYPAKKIIIILALLTLLSGAVSYGTYLLLHAYTQVIMKQRS